MSPIPETQSTDEVIQEVRRIKEELAASMDFDIDRIVVDARQKQTQGKRNVVLPPQRPTR